MADEREHMLAEAAVKADRDKRAMLDYAKDEGREEGRAEERLASATRMKAKGFSDDEIADILGMSTSKLKDIYTC
jgi:predicted transposase/invertase (TIGR01784 family)